MKLSGKNGIILFGIVVIMLGLIWLGSKQIKADKQYADLQNLQILGLEYTRTDNPQRKDSLAAVTLYWATVWAADYPKDELPPNLRAFIAELEDLKRERERTQAQ